MGNGYKLQTFNLFITSFWYTTFCELGESHMCLLHESFKKIYVLQLTVKRHKATFSKKKWKELLEFEHLKMNNFPLLRYEVGNKYSVYLSFSLGFSLENYRVIQRQMSKFKL